MDADIPLALFTNTRRKYLKIYFLKLCGPFKKNPCHPRRLAVSLRAEHRVIISILISSVKCHWLQCNFDTLQPNKIKTNSKNNLPPGDLKMDFTNEGKKI